MTKSSRSKAAQRCRHVASATISLIEHDRVPEIRPTNQSQWPRLTPRCPETIGALTGALDRAQEAMRQLQAQAEEAAAGREETRSAADRAAADSAALLRTLRQQLDDARAAAADDAERLKAASAHAEARPSPASACKLVP